MKAVFRIALCSLLLAGVVVADEKKVTPPEHDLLALAPADAMFLLYSRNLASLLENPALTMLAAEVGLDLTRLGQAWQETFDGATMIAIRAPALRPDAIGVRFAAKVSVDRKELFERLDNTLATALTAPGSNEPLIETGRSGQFATLRLRKLPFLALYVAVRDGIAYGDTSLPTVVDFANQHQAPAGFLDSEEYRRLFAAGPSPDRRGPGELLMYLNLRPLVAMLKMAMDGDAPGIFDALDLGTFESVGLAGDFSGAEGRLSISLGVADSDSVLPRLIAPLNRKLEAASLLPADYLVAVAGAMTSGSELAETVCDVMERIDPDIVDEYHAELAEVTREFGFDPQHDFLGNMVDEWAIGLTIDDEYEPRGVIVVKLADSDLFVAHLRNLITAYRLPVDTHVHRETEIICRADEGTPRVCLALLDNYLMVSNAAEAIAELVDTRTDGKTLATAHAPGSSAKLLSGPAAQVGYINVARLAQLALAEEDGYPDEAELLAFAQRVAKSDARIAVALTARPKLLRARFVLNESMTGVARGFLTQSIAASMAQARDQSKRAVSMGNIRSIVFSCQIHANAHKGAWPESLGQLAADGSVSLQHLASPYDATGPTSIEDADRLAFYVYRPGLTKDTIKDPSALVVVAESEIHRGQGAAFGFADGHVEWIVEPRAGELLAELRTAAR
ncbi:MAG: hypothetical protein ACYSVY_14810 [Planctomycetota bacterium]|jgi:prepilin-type processing-associated H-X9-DG protein